MEYVQSLNRSEIGSFSTYARLDVPGVKPGSSASEKQTKNAVKGDAKYSDVYTSSNEMTG